MLKHQELNVLAYIGGYILKKTCTIMCNECSNAYTAGSDLSCHDLIKLKNYSVHKGLMKPSLKLVHLLKKAEDCFNSNIDYCVRQNHVKATLFHLITVACANLGGSCDQCHSKQRLLKLFVTIRLHHSLRLFNDLLRDKSAKRQSKKYVKLSS